MASATELARAYDAYVSALWRGDVDVAPFRAWLDAHWRPEPAPQLAEPPAAVSPCGGGGRGIRWYEADTTVLGCVAGSGCYAVPIDAAPPGLGSARTDILLSVRHRDAPMAAASASPSGSDSGRPVVAGPIRGATVIDSCG